MALRVSWGIRRRTSVRSWSTIFLGSINWRNVKSGEYLAPDGHTSPHVSYTQQLPRPPNGVRLRAIGNPVNLMPLFSAHALSTCRLYDSGIGPCGYGSERRSSGC